MKKILLTLTLIVAAVTAKAVNATVYVQADEAPYLYGWFTVNAKETKINGAWPGKQMTEKVTKTNKDGEEIEFWYQTFSYPNTNSFNIIFNNGQDGVNKVQTGNISDIASDRYFTFDGTTGKYTDITENFGVEIPDLGNGNIGIALDEVETRTFLFTMSFAGGKDIYQGWTLSIEDGSGMESIRDITTESVAQKARYNLAGQRITGNYRGLVLANGKKVMMK